MSDRSMHRAADRATDSLTERVADSATDSATERTTDLRVIRTKEAIRQALTELMEEKGFDAVTVKDITTRARINRGTFYAHYQDKYDLLEQCEQKIMQDLGGLVTKNFAGLKSDLADRSNRHLPIHFIVSFLEYINENKAFLKVLLGPKGDSSFQARLKEFMWKTVFANEQQPLIREEQLLVPSDYLISYIASAHLGVLQQWLHSDRNESPQDIARILSTITVNGPFYAAGLKGEA